MKNIILKSALIVGFLFILLIISLLFYIVNVRKELKVLRDNFNKIEIGDKEDKVILLLGKPPVTFLCLDSKIKGRAILEKDSSMYNEMLNSKEEKLYRYYVKYNFSPDGSCDFILKDKTVVKKQFYE